MLAVAHAAGVKRFIHISTAAVYGITPPPGIGERGRSAAPYGQCLLR